MLIPYQNDLSNLQSLDLHASMAEITNWQGQQALKLDGLVIIPNLKVTDAKISVEIGAEDGCYRGVVFRLADPANYEMAYAQPHTSGQWDAIQYDPVFHNSNTWQIFYGPDYQKEALVPMNKWFSMSVDLKGNQAAIRVGDQDPLVVSRLAHPQNSGLVGLWTYRPAYFRNLCVAGEPSLAEMTAATHPLSPGLVEEWFLNGFGRVVCEPHGIINVNRYLPASIKVVRLTRLFEATRKTGIELCFGFSDKLSLLLDRKTIFTGQNNFNGFGGWQDRGYVEPDTNRLSVSVSAGIHRLSVVLRVIEPFGWGFTLALQGKHTILLPVEMG
ncbi:MAG: hypothetical protein EHM70_05675 [Chloroflexota bacterium]|nr:MAG: hypothetical protein EHM70_05675 [Chloroflexota bacterium]